MDKFKQYLQEHAKDLEVEAPGVRVWKNISQQHIVPTQKGIIISIMKYAVAACVILLAGIGVWHLTTNQHDTVVATIQSIKDTISNNKGKLSANDTSIPSNTTTEIAVNTLVNVSKIHANNNTGTKVVKTNSQSKTNHSEKEMLQYVENGFTQVINIEKQRVNSSPLYAESPAYFNDFKNRMMQMDNDEKLIRKDIKENGPDNQMIDQMINIYQQKLNLLRQLQTEMNKLNNRYKQNRPASDSVGSYFLNI